MSVGAVRGAPNCSTMSASAFGNGEKVALVGANGVGNTTLLRLISGEATPTCGTISIDGRLGVMRQLVGTANDTMTARDLMVSLAPKQLQIAAARLTSAEADAVDQPMRYAHALAEWGDAGGYDAEVFWDTCATRAVGLAFVEIADRALRTFSGGEQKRLALEALLRSDFDVLMLDEPDNFLHVAGKRWLADELRRTPKTVLFVSHDRELLAVTATKVACQLSNPCQSRYPLADAGRISKCASTGAWLLIVRMSCGQADITHTQSSRARSTT